MGGGCRGEVTIDIRPEFETQAATVNRLTAENNERKSEIRQLAGTIENLDKSVSIPILLCLLWQNIHAMQILIVDQESHLSVS